MTDELAAIEARDADWDATFSGADWRAADVLRDRRDLLAALHAEQAARARVESALRTIRDECNASREDIADKHGTETRLLFAVIPSICDAALAPDASEGEPNA